MPEAEYLPVVPHFNPAHPDYAAWARETRTPALPQAPATEEPPVPEPDPDEKPQPSRKQSS